MHGQRDNAKIKVTFFKNFAATRLTAQDLTLPKLRGLILKTRAATKAELPWLKLAEFGNERTKAKSLRHDANVTSISGIELDYDREKMSWEEAVDILKEMNVCALLYTSPSHTIAAPRWRVLLPVSRALPPEMRAKLVARVNGRFGNVFAPESFTLSQSYYYGKALDNPAPDHRAEIIPGRYIDLAHDLLRFEPGSKTNAFLEYGRRDTGPHGFDEHIARLGDGLAGYNDPLSRSAAAYVAEHGSDFDRDALKKLLREHIDDAPKKANRNPADIERYLSDNYLDDIIASAVRKFGEINLPSSPIIATPFVWINPDRVPQRQWLYRPHYLRQFPSLTVSTGGVGKSSMLIVEALAMVTGRALLNIHPVTKLRVWYFNGEDPTEELQRRFAAAALYYKINEEDIAPGYLYVDSGRTMPIVLAEEGRHGTTIAVPVIEQVISTIRENRIDVIIVDPFVSIHRVPENDNGAIERVAKTWSHIAEVTNCAVMLAHHTRKTQGGSNVGVDDGRGASALLAAVRVARTLNTMSDKEATDAGIHESERRGYYRSDIGKANLTRAAERADWFRLESVDLGNTKPGEEPDTVGVVTAWDYPTFEMPEVTEALIKAALAAVKAGGPWRLSPQSKTHPWIGIPIAKTLKLDPESKHTRKFLIDLIDGWLGQHLDKVTRVDPVTRHRREFIEVTGASLKR
jgi:hypothetical protein